MMSRRESGRRLGAVALAAWVMTGAVATVANAAQQQTTHWARFPNGCAVTPAELQVACGRFGTFAFNLPGAPPPCAADGSVETIKTYGAPKGYQSLPVEHPPVENPEEWELPVGLVQGQPAAVVKGAPVGGELWSAVIDWDTWHGKSIAWIMIDMAPSTRLLFLDLLDPSLDVVGEGVSDAHVLAKLCRIEDMVDRDVAPAPQVVNLSFGRYATQLEALGGDRCNGDRLSCWITRVIESMTEAGTVVATAAGNHRSLLFPAVIDATVAVGALDLTVFEANNVAQATWESPAEVDAWLTADNVCLRGGWYAPAGTSFAAGIFSGWLLAAWQERPELDPSSVRAWSPTWLADGCLALTADGVPLHDCLLEISSFMNLVFDPTSPASPCYRPPSGDNETIEVPVPTGPFSAPRFESFDRWTATAHNPTPENDFCIPCHGGGGGGGGAITFAMTKAMGSIPVGPNGLVLDLSASPPTNGFIDTLYLRSDRDFYRLELDPEELLAIGKGMVDRLIIAKGRLLIDEGSQPSLVAVIRTLEQMSCDEVAAGTYLGPGRCYWSPTPIYMD